MRRETPAEEEEREKTKKERESASASFARGATRPVSKTRRERRRRRASQPAKTKGCCCSGHAEGDEDGRNAPRGTERNWRKKGRWEEEGYMRGREREKNSSFAANLTFLLYESKPMEDAG